VNTFQPVDGSGEQLFEIEMSERFGNIIKFGVKLIDDPTTNDGDIQSTATLSSYTIDVSWKTGDYSFWQNQFYNSQSVADAGITVTPSYEQGDVNGDTDIFTFAMEKAGGITFTENEYIAEFMLERTSLATSDDFYLEKGQYTVWDADDIGTERPEAPSYFAPFNFAFDAHNLTLGLANKYFEEVPNVEVFVTDVATTDGLSVVPVSKNGNIIKYEVVMNIPKPSFITEIDIDPNHMIAVSGANIFKESVTMLNVGDLLTEEASNLLANASVTVKTGQNDLAVSTPSVDATTGEADYTGQEFFHKVAAAFDNSNDSVGLDNLATIDEFSMAVTGLVRPALAAAANGDPLLAEGRYVIAEFYALGDSESPNAISYASDSSATNVFNLGNMRYITREFDDGSAVSGGFTRTISDGSEAVVLADGIYVKSNIFDDAVGAVDAIGASLIAAKEAEQAGSTGAIYSSEALIAADFNQDNKVTAADASDILRYVVNGEEPGNYIPEWTFVDRIDTVTIDASNVQVDPLVNAFAYDAIDLDVTAILRGDTTSSYTYTDVFSQVDEIVFALENLSEFGYLAPIVTKYLPDDGIYYAIGTGGDDIFRLGNDTGIHLIEDGGVVYDSGTQTYSERDKLVLDPSAYEIWDDGSYAETGGELDFASLASGIDATTMVTILAALNTAMTENDNGVFGEWYDTGSDDAFWVDAMDLNGDSAIDATNDLIIVSFKGHFHVEENPLYVNLETVMM
jgi:hypothetical protein